MVIVLRVGAMSVEQVPPLVATAAVFVETFVVMSVGAAIAGLVAMWLPIPSWVMVTACLFAVCGSLPTLPPVLRWFARKVTKVNLAANERRIDFSLVFRGWLLSTISWLLFGTSLAILISAIPSPQPLPNAGQLFAIATAAVSLATVLGFASLIPGGAGVRELVLATVLGASLGPSQALLTAIAHRILSIVVEAILAAGSWICLRYTGGQERVKQ